MKRFFWIWLTVVIVGLVAWFAIPALAGEPNTNPAPLDQQTWDEMHQACADGDWEAMQRAAEEVYGSDFAGACHGDSSSPNTGGNMGSGRYRGGMGGYMGGGGGGMMGSW